MCSEHLACAHMDLDTVAWEADSEQPTRRSLQSSQADILRFIGAERQWVVEGCYADLLELVLPRATEIVFLNPGTETCVENARNRPWEPHKYPTEEAQNANLEMLIAWIRDYERRADEFSYRAHRQLFQSYPGQKHEFTANRRSLHLLTGPSTKP